MPNTQDKKSEEKEELWQGLQQQKPLRRGDIITGVVVSIEREGFLVDIGSKSEGIIPHYEMQSLGGEGSQTLKVGEEVLLYVLRGADEKGQMLLSFDRARMYRGWYLLEQHLNHNEIIEAQVIAFNKGGLIINYENVQGFVPNSQLASNRHQAPVQAEGGSGQNIGQPINLKILELDKQRNRLILSERAAIREQREQQKENLLAELRVGEVRRGKVSSIHNFGAFVDLGGLDSLLPASELSWERGTTPAQALQAGEELDVYVMKVDKEAKRVVVSRRRTQPHPWDSIREKYKVGELVTGTVTNVVNFGAFVRLDSGIEGLVHISELADHRLADAKEAVNKGDVVTLKILSIDSESHRLRLSLRQAPAKSSI